MSIHYSTTLHEKSIVRSIEQIEFELEFRYWVVSSMPGAQPKKNMRVVQYTKSI